MFGSAAPSASTPVPRPPLLSMQVVGLAMAAGFWSACYAVQPSKTVARPVVAAVARSKRGAQAQAAYSAALAQATRAVARMPWLSRVRGRGKGSGRAQEGPQGGDGGTANPAWVAPSQRMQGQDGLGACCSSCSTHKSVPLAPRALQAPGVDPARLTVSLAESLCLRASIKPLTFPFKIWASYKLVLFGKELQLGRQAKQQQQQQPAAEAASSRNRRQRNKRAEA